MARRRGADLSAVERGPRPARSAMYIFSMSHREDEHRDLFVLDVTYQPIIADAIPPQSLFVAMQRLTLPTRIVRRTYPLPQEPDDQFLCFAIKFLDLLLSRVLDLNL